MQYLNHQRHQRRTLSSIMSIMFAISALLMLRKGLCFLTKSSHPAMVVTSESMAPSFHRGDIIFLWNREETVRVGDIPVVWFPSKPLPMVHRAIKVYHEGLNNDGGAKR